MVFFVVFSLLYYYFYRFFSTTFSIRKTRWYVCVRVYTIQLENAKNIPDRFPVRAPRFGGDEFNRRSRTPTAISRPQTLVGPPSRYTYIIFFVSTPSIHNINYNTIILFSTFRYCIVVIASATPLIMKSTYLLFRYIFSQATWDFVTVRWVPT